MIHTIPGSPPCDPCCTYELGCGGVDWSTFPKRFPVHFEGEDFCIPAAVTGSTIVRGPFYGPPIAGGVNSCMWIASYVDCAGCPGYDGCAEARAFVACCGFRPLSSCLGLGDPPDRHEGLLNEARVKLQGSQMRIDWLFSTLTIHPIGDSCSVGFVANYSEQYGTVGLAAIASGGLGTISGTYPVFHGVPSIQVGEFTIG